MFSDFGALLLHGTDRQIGLIPRLDKAIHDRRAAADAKAPAAIMLHRVIPKRSPTVSRNWRSTTTCGCSMRAQPVC
jgi:hypothetical protein